MYLCSTTLQGLVLLVVASVSVVVGVAVGPVDGLVRVVGGGDVGMRRRRRREAPGEGQGSGGGGVGLAEEAHVGLGRGEAEGGRQDQERGDLKEGARVLPANKQQ